MGRRLMLPQIAVGLIASTALSVRILEGLHDRSYAGREMNTPSRDDVMSHIYNYRLNKMIIAENQIPLENDVIKDIRRKYDRSLNAVSDTVGATSNFVTSNYAMVKDTAVAHFGSLKGSAMAELSSVKDSLKDSVKKLF